MSPLWRDAVSLVVKMLLFCAVVHATTLYHTITVRTPPDVPTVPFPPSTSPVPTAPLADVLQDMNWTACPSRRDDPTDGHFRLWDEMLAQSLRRSAQGFPKMRKESWHAVTEHIHVYSAFLVTTTERAIHIISLVRNNELNGTAVEHPPLVCIVQTSNATITRNASIRLVWTFFEPSFQNAFVMCPSPQATFSDDEDVQVAIVATGYSDSSLRWLRLHRPPKKSKKKCCAVCVRPLFGALSLWKIVEFVAHYRFLGARSFYFYDLNMTLDARLLFARMQSLRVDVTFVSFKLIVNATIDHAQVQAHGQVPALYDCIFRSLSKMEYYVHVDIDELMVPPRNLSVPKLVRKMERKHKRRLGSLMIPTRYHCAEYPLNYRYASREYLPLQTRVFIYHPARQLHDTSMRKYIARSRTVCQAGVHSVQRHCGRRAKSFCLRGYAVIRHYKRCCIYKAGSRNDKFASLYNVTRVSPDRTFAYFSARIEEDMVVRALRSLIDQSENNILT
ncbi:hypothetical protein HPB50_010228 [Hyalomma asiaticum]|uniref:Uncharacterized protein n=1 Tax=Hyalomma asiaticum TaxID=266040 RepID=A0ACB7RMW6_HYAAI|nr:hypothetical protein HPB50_010228 [Hyalomma asiaticum]